MGTVSTGIFPFKDIDTALDLYRPSVAAGHLCQSSAASTGVFVVGTIPDVLVRSWLARYSGPDSIRLGTVGSTLEELWPALAASCGGSGARSEQLH